MIRKSVFATTTMAATIGDR